MTSVMQNTKTEELTLLALGEKSALIGDGGGLVRRACVRCLERVKTVAPRRLYIDAEDKIFGMPVIISEDMPRDLLAYAQTSRDFVTGLGFRGFFDPATRTWFVQELKDPATHEATGKFFFTESDAALWESA